MMTQNIREERTWRKGQKQAYTDRPLSEEEKAFSADPDNYYLLFYYMKLHRLDPEEWYDILIIPYLQAVKKYLSFPQLQEKHDFTSVLFMTLKCERSNYYKSINAKKRKPEGGICSLDLVFENDNGREHHAEAWIIDRKTSVERQVIFKELFEEFYQKCITIIDDYDGESFVSEYLKCELDLLLEGFTIKQVNRKTEKQYPYGYDVEDLERDIEGFRQIFREVFGI